MKYNCKMNTPAGQAHVTVARMPLFLRFVFKPQKEKAPGASNITEWDALDLLDDTIRRGEEILVGVKAGLEGEPFHLLCGRMKGGRSATGWYQNVVYHIVDPQPPREVARDNEKWQEWCYKAQAVLEERKKGVPVEKPS